jgi:glycosyltransferase EpsH
MDSQPSVSVVIPIYNAERYLDNCLKSILGQTYLNIEVICVNDGSTDASVEIARRYAAIDERMIILDKINEGVSKARNDGIKAASGEFVMFVDADDWIERNTCKVALAAMLENNADIVIWSYISETATRSTRKEIFPENQVFESKEVKLYRKSVIEKSDAVFIDLDQIGTYEDGLFNLQVFGEAHKVVYLAEYFYHYRRTGGTSVTSGYRETLFEQWQNLFQYMQTYIDDKKLSPMYQEGLSNRIALSIIGLGLNIVSAPEFAGKKIKLIRQILNTDCYREAYRRLEMKYFPIHWKVFFGCAKLRFSLGIYVLLGVMQKIISM